MMIVGFVLFFVGFIFVIAYPINKRKNARCSAETQGMLYEIRKRYNSEGDLKDMHIYSYNVDGIEYRLETIDHSLQVHNIGDTCTIWYNPNKPKDAQAFRGSDNYLKTLLYAGIAMLLLGILLFFLSLT